MPLAHTARHDLNAYAKLPVQLSKLYHQKILRARVFWAHQSILLASNDISKIGDIIHFKGFESYQRMFKPGNLR